MAARETDEAMHANVTRDASTKRNINISETGSGAGGAPTQPPWSYSAGGRHGTK